MHYFTKNNHTQIHIRTLLNQKNGVTKPLANKDGKILNNK